jgi:hypothetical protein
MNPNISPQPTQPITPAIQTPVASPPTAPTQIQTPPTTPSNPNPLSRKTMYILLAVLILLILVVVGGIYYLVLAKQQSTSQKNNLTVTSPLTPTSTPTPILNPTGSWKTYSAKNYSLEIPQNWYSVPYKDFNIIDCVALGDLPNPDDAFKATPITGHSLIDVCFTPSSTGTPSATMIGVTTFYVNGYFGQKTTLSSQSGLVETVGLYSPYKNGALTLVSKLGNISILDQIVSTVKFLN